MPDESRGVPKHVACKLELINLVSLAVISSVTRFLDHTQRRTTVSTTPLDKWSARRRVSILRKLNLKLSNEFPQNFRNVNRQRDRPQYVAAGDTGNTLQENNSNYNLIIK